MIASETRGGDELVDPSTIDGDKWVVHKKGGPLVLAVLSAGCVRRQRPLSPTPCLPEGSWKQSAVKPATPSTQQHQPQQAHVRQAEAAQKQQAVRLAAGYDTAMLLAIYCSSCWVMSIVRPSVCAQCSKTLCVQVRYVTPRY